MRRRNNSVAKKEMFQQYDLFSFSSFYFNTPFLFTTIWVQQSVHNPWPQGSIRGQRGSLIAVPKRSIQMGQLK
jgi:hypothetical protein